MVILWWFQRVCTVHECTPLIIVFVRVHHNYCSVKVCFQGKINEAVVSGRVPALIDESREAVFKCVSVNTVRPV